MAQPRIARRAGGHAFATVADSRWHRPGFGAATSAVSTGGPTGVKGIPEIGVFIMRPGSSPGSHFFFLFFQKGGAETCAIEWYWHNGGQQLETFSRWFFATKKPPAV